MKKCFVALLLCAGILSLSACATGKHQLADLTAPSGAVQLERMWLQMAQEMQLDMNRPARLQEMSWQFDPNGRLQRFMLRIQAVPHGRPSEVVYQVEGDLHRTTWFTVTDRPGSAPERPSVRDLFAALDKAGFPSALWRDLAPADLYIVETALTAQPPVNGLRLLLAQGQVRAWTADDSLRYQEQRLPAVQVRAMQKVGASSGDYVTRQQAFYLIP